MNGALLDLLGFAALPVVVGEIVGMAIGGVVLWVMDALEGVSPR